MPPKPCGVLKQHEKLTETKAAAQQSQTFFKVACSCQRTDRISGSVVSADEEDLALSC